MITAIACAVCFIVGFVVGGHSGARWARRDEWAWQALIRRIRNRGGRCDVCGNLRAPEPIIPCPPVLVAIVMLLVAAGAHAQGNPGDDPDAEIARRHFDAGTVAYGEGRYREAVTEFEAARRARALPAFDFNIARSLDRIEQAGEAIDAYERYLTAAPGAPDAAEVRARVAVLGRRLAAPPRPPARHRALTWAFGGAGAVVLSGSLAAGLVAQVRYSALSGMCAPDGTCSSPGAQALIDSGHGAAMAADTLLGIGIAAAVVGIVLFFSDWRAQ